MPATDPRGALADDPRTAGIRGHPHTVTLLSRHSAALLAALHEDEPVVWALTSIGPLQPPDIAPAKPPPSWWARAAGEGQQWVLARTPTRLLALPTNGDRPRVHVLTGPWGVHRADPNSHRLAPVVEVTGTDGSMTVRAKINDRPHLDWDAHRHDTMPTTPARPPHPQQQQPRRVEDRSATTPPTAVPGNGGWNWNQPVTSWQRAEQLAADHMRHLGFAHVHLTVSGVDGGIDVLASGAAAQVKDHTRPAGGPDIQRLVGAAHDIPDRLFYATGYTPAAEQAARTTGVALFVFERTAGAVTPANLAARTLSPAQPGGDERGPFGVLTLDGRRTRALRWAQQIQDAASTKPVSDRKRKRLRQLQDRLAAHQATLEAMEQLADSTSPMYKTRTATKMVGHAEDALRTAAKQVGVRLH